MFLVSGKYLSWPHLYHFIPSPVGFLVVSKKSTRMRKHHAPPELHFAPPLWFSGHRNKDDLLVTKVALFLAIKPLMLATCGAGLTGLLLAIELGPKPTHQRGVILSVVIF